MPDPASTIQDVLEDIRATLLGVGVMTTKGDLVAGDVAGVPDRLAVGATRKILQANSGAALGVEWADVLTALGEQTVGTGQATIAHGLAYTPTIVLLTMTTSGSIWKSAATDATNIYLTGSAATRKAEVWVR